MNQTLKRLAKIERQVAVDEDTESTAIVVRYVEPGHTDLDSPEEEEAIQREVEAAIKACRGTPNLPVVYWPPLQPCGDDIDRGGGAEQPRKEQ